MALLQEDIFRLSLSVVGRGAACSCSAVLCSQSDADRSLGPALDPRFTWQACSLTPVHGLARQLQTPARPISLVRGGLAYLAWQFKPGWPHWPLGHSRQLFLAHLRRVANQNKQPTGPVPTKKIR
jgi:hypothetical protein